MSLRLLPIYRNAFAVAALAMGLAIAATARAQTTGTATVEGRATTHGDGTGIGYALVRLSGEGGSTLVRTTLTDQQGNFRFAAVPPGTYRLTLERIGFQSDASEPFSAPADATVRRELVSRPVAVAIRGIVATPECRSARDLDRNPALAALWREALKAIETTRAFDAAYAYSFVQRQYWSRDHDDSPVDSLISRVVNDPAHPRPSRDRRGWGNVDYNRLTLEIPDGREILDPAFLTTHCLEGSSSVSDDVAELGFRPIRTPRNGRVDIQGVVRLDLRTLQLRSIDVDYLAEAEPFMETTIEYVDAAVPGGTIRLQAGARFRGRPPRQTLVPAVRGEVQFTNYSGMVRADSAAGRPQG